jgi:hypothetical protein
MRGSALRLSRQQLFAGRRYASNTTQASQQAAQTAAKAKETAANVANKSIEILGKAGSSFSSIAAKAGGRTGRLLRTIEGEFKGQAEGVRGHDGRERCSSQLSVIVRCIACENIIVSGCCRALCLFTSFACNDHLVSCASLRIMLTFLQPPYLQPSITPRSRPRWPRLLSVDKR